MPRRPLNLLEKFSLLSFLSVTALSIGLGFATSELLTRTMIEHEWQDTAELVRYQTRVYALDQLFAEPALHQDYRRMKDALDSLLSLPEVVRVKVWDRTGAVIWSTDEGLIGRRYPDNRELAEALAGKVSVQLKDLKKAENAQERKQFSKLAEVYVPIFAEGDRQRVTAVVEIYKVPGFVFAAIRHAKTMVWGISLLGGLLLYVSLFWIVRVSYRSQLRLEQNLRQSREEIETTAGRNAELDSFVYSVSHDLKAPLVTIQGMAGVLVEDFAPHLPPEGRHYVERIQANAQQMERLILDLLALSRIGREAHAAEPVHLAELIDEVVGGFAEPISARGIKVSQCDLGTLWGIRVQLEQVFNNLVGNAVKYLGDTPSPAIEIGSVERGAFVECYVRDNGIGIDPAYHAKVFEIFQRLKEVEAPGTGVGLAIVKKIVEGAGGRIWVESAPGQGATFRFTWPQPPREERS